jgi:hypothetical protein
MNSNTRKITHWPWMKSWEKWKSKGIDSAYVCFGGDCSLEVHRIFSKGTQDRDVILL